MNPRLRWVAVVAFAAGIFALSSISKPVPSIPRVPGIDKAAHFVLYSLFAATVLWALSGSRNRARRGGPLVLALVISCLYGASDEIHQYFVPGRTMSLGDWCADAAGALALVTFFWLRSRRRSHFM